jgi:hypothetical protein
LAFLAGGVLAAASWLPVFSPSDGVWPAEKASAYRQASLKIQELTHELGNLPPEDLSREDAEQFRSAMDNYESIRAELESAQQRHRAAWGPLLRIGGFFLLIASAFLYFATLRLPLRGMKGVHLQRKSPDDSSGQFTA